MLIDYGEKLFYFIQFHPHFKLYLKKKKKKPRKALLIATSAEMNEL